MTKIAVTVIRSAIVENPVLHAKFTALFDRTAVIADRSFYIAVIGIFDLFGSCALDLDPMTFTYELDPYCVEICHMCKYELPTLTFRKLSSDIHT